MILLIDNYDSFTHNISRYVGILGHERKVVRNDGISLDEIAEMDPEAIILSSGSGKASRAGICCDLIRKFGPEKPVFGIGLGHQCIGEVFGGRTVPAKFPLQGKTSMLDHPGRGIFIGLPNPLRVARYHSLAIDLPANSQLMTSAVSEEGDIMAMRHCQFPTFGVQFQPESVLTDYGLDMMRNFIAIARQWNEGERKPSKAA